MDFRMARMLKDISIFTAPTEEWVCPECVLIMTAENMDTRSRAMRLLTVDQLIVLLRHALARMRTVSGKYCVEITEIYSHTFLTKKILKATC